MLINPIFQLFPELDVRPPSWFSDLDTSQKWHIKSGPTLKSYSASSLPWPRPRLPPVWMDFTTVHVLSLFQTPKAFPHPVCPHVIDNSLSSPVHSSFAMYIQTLLFPRLPLPPTISVTSHSLKESVLFPVWGSDEQRGWDHSSLGFFVNISVVRRENRWRPPDHPLIWCFAP